MAKPMLPKWPTYRYTVSQHGSRKYNQGALIDRGANGGVAGEDVRIVDQHTPFKTVDIQGIDDHQITNVRLGTVGAVVPSQRGDVIVIMHQYALNMRGKTIHSSLQLEAYKNEVNDRSAQLPGGKQHIRTLDGYVHPLDFKRWSGLCPHASIHQTRNGKNSHMLYGLVMMTGTHPLYDNILSDQEEWYDSISDLPDRVTTLRI